MKGFFQGWYFKCSSKELTIAFILALHHDGRKTSASLQILENDSVHFIPYKSIIFDSSRQILKIGRNIFSLRGAHLDIKNSEITIKGDLTFSQHQKISYDIMGPFQYLPFMQCRHRIYSMSNKVNGTLDIDEKSYSFTNDLGYIEGDRGYSFPKEYAWSQCHFQNGSLMLAAADIPILGFHFTGIISTIIVNGMEYRLATYLGAKVKINDNCISITQGKYKLFAELIESKKYQLHAPDKGKMTRFIKENPCCVASYRFSYKGKTIIDFVSNKASFEYEYYH